MEMDNLVQEKIVQEIDDRALQSAYTENESKIPENTFTGEVTNGNYFTTSTYESLNTML